MSLSTSYMLLARVIGLLESSWSGLRKDKGTYALVDRSISR